MSLAVADYQLVEPAFLWVPEHVSSAGGEALDFAKEMGLEPEPEQVLALDVILAERADGRWAAPEAAIVAPRQNLKSFVFEIVSMSDLWLGFGSELIVWTAHEFNTAMEAFRDVKTLVETHDFLSRRVKKITEGNGTEGIELVDGRRLRFKARTKTGGRGLTGDRTILDEAFALRRLHMSSLMPTMSAKSQKGNPQILYGSMAGMVDSEVLRTIRDRGRPGGDPSLAYLEWCAPPKACEVEDCDHSLGVEGCVLDDVEMRQAANSGLGRRISNEWIETNERKTMEPADFARERLGWWDDPEDAVDGMPLDVWNACRDPESEIVEVKGWAVAPSEDLRWCSIGVAGLRTDGTSHVEAIDYRRGTSWVAERMVELRGVHGEAPVAVEGKGPRSSIADDLAEVGIEAVVASSSDMVDACGELQDSLLRRALWHIGQPELDVSVKGAKRRLVGDAWVWSRRGSTVEISPLIAATAALWVARQVAAEGELEEVDLW